jgi:hypothetical protein
MGKYGITSAEYEQMFENAGRRCEICGCGRRNTERPLCVDHCHFTGKVRGLLCNKCNLAVGMLDDCHETVQRAVAYLRRTNEV